MRYLKIASAKNPDNDFIELNDFNGFLCTQFQTLGISRKVEFLEIKNRNIPVDNKPVFKKYSLVVEILTPYSQYENKYYQLINFLDRNKKHGFRLYYKPYHSMNSEVYRDTTEGRYCLCNLESSSKTEKRQPIVLNLSQESLWLGELNAVTSSQRNEESGNLFVFDNDNGYYSASFSLDTEIPDYYCVSFYNGIKQQADISIIGYNEIPLTIRVSGFCVNPQVFLYRKNEEVPIKKFQVFTEIDDGWYLEINSGILENGVWEVERETGRRIDLTENVNYEYGSPYFNLENGEYYIEVSDDGGNECLTSITWREEYSE